MDVSQRDWFFLRWHADVPLLILLQGILVRLRLILKRELALGSTLSMPMMSTDFIVSHPKKYRSKFQNNNLLQLI